ncbi:MAG: hypothetical protein GX051_03160 [Clostridiales bacterium]|jgi:hypothetical protein|nr:hypothetical protein [Clostridiales bacterium]
MSVSFNGFNEKILTFKTSGTVAAGAPVQLTSSGTVAASANDASFCGIAVTVSSDGFAGVQLCGYIEVPYSGTAPAVGYALLESNGNGGVKVDTTNGRSVLVATVDTTASKVGIIL